jgi:uncharacterized RDD family membrane protein YckC
MTSLPTAPLQPPTQASPPAPLQAPSLGRRLACFVYEGVLLFGVVMVAGFVYGVLRQQRHALVGTSGLQIVVFMVLGAYFAGFWSRTGQTLAMQTWQIRLVTAGGDRVGLLRAICRYLLSWMWFLPALMLAAWRGHQDNAAVFSGMAAGIAAYAALTWLRPDRQYWHDVACGTRLVRVQALNRQPT